MEHRPCRSAAYKRTLALEARLAEQSKRLREQANLLPAGKERDQLLSKASQADTGSRLSQWLTSPGLQPQNKSIERPAILSYPFAMPGTDAERFRQEADECRKLAERSWPPRRLRS